MGHIPMDGIYRQVLNDEPGRVSRLLKKHLAAWRSFQEVLSELLVELSANWRRQRNLAIATIVISAIAFGFPIYRLYMSVNELNRHVKEIRRMLVEQDAKAHPRD
jgi:hypothetical protein